MSDSSPFQPPPFENAPYAGDDLDEELEDTDELETDDLDEDEADEDEADEAEADELDDEAAAEPATSQRATAQGNSVEGGAARSVLEHVARSIVDEPDAVLVDVGSGRSGVRLSLHVAPSDMGRIIGKRGRVAQAMRTVVRAAAAGEGTDASVDIVD